MNARRLSPNATCFVPLFSFVTVADLTASDSEPSSWQGIDETVVERVAVEAGRPPREPLLNTDQGDLLLFLFLLAGAVGGFVMGYCFRGLFPPRRQDTDRDA
jgi:ABC-type cobalt transport system substrate-binding protein